MPRTGRKKTTVTEKIAKIPLDLKKVQLLYFHGFTDEEVADFMGVSIRTVERWKKDNDFLACLKKGKKIADQKVVHSLYERAFGYTHPEEVVFQYQGKVVRAQTLKHYPPDTGACAFWLKNRMPDQWRDKQEIEHTVPEHLLEEFKDMTNEQIKKLGQELFA